jgi:hypothetical protein
MTYFELRPVNFILKGNEVKKINMGRPRPIIFPSQIIDFILIKDITINNLSMLFAPIPARAIHLDTFDDMAKRYKGDVILHLENLTRVELKGCFYIIDELLN